MSMSDRTAAEFHFGTRLVWGAGSWARVSRCLDRPMVQLYATREEADAKAANGKRCCQDCRGTEHHSTEFVPSLKDECPIELGERESAH